MHNFGILFGLGLFLYITILVNEFSPGLFYGHLPPFAAAHRQFGIWKAKALEALEKDFKAKLPNLAL